MLWKNVHQSTKSNGKWLSAGFEEILLKMIMHIYSYARTSDYGT